MDFGDYAVTRCCHMGIKFDFIRCTVSGTPQLFGDRYYRNTNPPMWRKWLQCTVFTAKTEYNYTSDPTIG